MIPPNAEFDDLPPEMQAAIKRRDAVTLPTHNAIASLDLTWGIARGNLAALEGALLALFLSGRALVLQRGQSRDQNNSQS